MVTDLDCSAPGGWSLHHHLISNHHLLCSLQVAFLGSAIYQFAVYDPTLFGAFMRGLPFFNFAEADHVKMVGDQPVLT